ncbi:hypothetical protein BC830DRAFT_1168247 [Chytriomyces sp. MP71]|nr:hypothetical protein BC830DRAFT_1168247 [Chytriomyces sp. MP71]
MTIPSSMDGSTQRTLDTLPPELLTLIFSWIHPSLVCRYRRLSTQFEAVIHSATFARTLFRRFAEYSSVATPPATALNPGNRSREPTELDRLVFRFPAQIRHGYVSYCMAHIEHIDWQNLNLHGASIPAEFGRLSRLLNLTIDSSGLGGRIPVELTELRRLVYLGIWQNELVGEIPREIGERLTNLQKLFLFSNRLSGPLPREIGQLTQLTELYLHDNQLSGPLIPELGLLVRLKALMLDNNQFSGPIPPEIGNLVNLTGLYLNNNALCGVLPPTVGQLTLLRYLSLQHNRLSGSVPQTVTNLINLQRFDLTENAGVECDFVFEVMQI